MIRINASLFGIGLALIAGNARILVGNPGALPGSADPLVTAAEYYFSRHDYRQALQLWSEVVRHQPADVRSLERLAELKLMLEGRLAAREVILPVLLKDPNDLSLDARKALRTKLTSLQNTFLTDESLSVYLQGVPKASASDCAAALPLFQHAANLEKGNVRVLKEKARCEKRLAFYDRYYETLKSAYENNPFDPLTLDELIEAHIYYLQFDAATALYKRNSENEKSVRLRLAYAVALTRLNPVSEEAASVFQSILEESRQTGVHPALFLFMGKLLAAKPANQGEASAYLSRFLIAMSRPESAKIDGWDPYHCKDEMESVKALLVRLKEKADSKAEI